MTDDGLNEENVHIPLDNDDLQVCTSMPSNIVGELVELYRDKAVVRFRPNERMIMDESKMIHAGFVFNAASFAAMAAINKKYSVLIASDVKFLAPIELGHEITFKAQAIQSDTKKCEVKVEGFLLDIKIFDSLFHIAVFDKKIFKLRFKDE
ncbi:thioesterase [Helicobacter cinaedi]|uniref:Thioesterase n=1 Tax=Helicobacter cinaedi TaxID=213 RepID=A0A377JU43_9HELI|nr:hotdog domain-containing protein [Helicobacter cinaedi]BDB66266.1 thioesterase [Helicobacter cinaedi]STP11426.1 thioesterase [Helicobacter cinaedi]